jgi:hypothetical protein
MKAIYDRLLREASWVAWLALELALLSLAVSSLALWLALAK